jgi:hypothetical protein
MEEATIMTTQMSTMKEKLGALIKGNVVVPDDPGYEEARRYGTL